jgi:glycosyltransferase involved in cell wall biosynthesis
MEIPPVNCVMLVRDRLRLTQQSLCSFMTNTDIPANLTIVDDGSGPETAAWLREYAAIRDHPQPVALLRNESLNGVTGAARNLAVCWSENYFDRGDFLYLSDNDVFFTLGWLGRLVAVSSAGPTKNFKLIGGQNHPFHQPLSFMRWMDPPIEVREYYAVAGTSQLMRWKTWDEFGPLCHRHAQGTNRSEDHAMCQGIRAAGYHVGAIWPHVVIDCGLHQTDGSESIGMSAKPLFEGIVQE